MGDLLHLGEFVFMAGVVYGAIRSDIKGIHEKIAAAESAVIRAHDRIDKFLERDK